MRKCFGEGKLKYKSKFRLRRYFIIKYIFPFSPNVLTDILIQSFIASKMSSNLLLSYTDFPQFFIVFLFLFTVPRCWNELRMNPSVIYFGTVHITCMMMLFYLNMYIKTHFTAFFFQFSVVKRKIKTLLN